MVGGNHRRARLSRSSRQQQIAAVDHFRAVGYNTYSPYGEPWWRCEDKPGDSFDHAGRKSVFCNLGGTEYGLPESENLVAVTEIGVDGVLNTAFFHCLICRCRRRRHSRLGVASICCHGYDGE